MATENPAPAVGMGMTAKLYTDAHAFTITRASPTGKGTSNISLCPRDTLVTINSKMLECPDEDLS